jgi:hypothetical protein
MACGAHATAICHCQFQGSSSPPAKTPVLVLGLFAVCISYFHVSNPNTNFLYPYRSFWRNGAPIAHTYALSVGENKYLKRRLPLLRNREADIAATFKMMEQKAIADGFDPTSTKYDPQWHPFSWQLQTLVVQDPFIPTYVSLALLSRFIECQIALCGLESCRICLSGNYVPLHSPSSNNKPSPRSQLAFHD